MLVSPHVNLKPPWDDRNFQYPMVTQFHNCQSLHWTSLVVLCLILQLKWSNLFPCNHHTVFTEQNSRKEAFLPAFFTPNLHPEENKTMLFYFTTSMFYPGNPRLSLLRRCLILLLLQIIFYPDTTISIDFKWYYVFLTNLTIKDFSVCEVERSVFYFRAPYTFLQTTNTWMHSEGLLRKPETMATQTQSSLIYPRKGKGKFKQCTLESSWRFWFFPFPLAAAGPFAFSVAEIRIWLVICNLVFIFWLWGKRCNN